MAAVAAVPLFFNLRSARVFEPDKVVLLRCLAALAILAWTVGTLERAHRRPPRGTLREWMRRPLALPVVLLLAVQMLATAFAITPRISFWGSYERLQGTYTLLSCVALFAVAAGTLRTRPQVERVVTAIVLASVPVSLYGLAQAYGPDPIPWAAGARPGVTSTLGSPNFAGAYLLMVVPLTLHRLIRSVRRRRALAGAAYLLALSAQLAVIVLSRSRAPILGLCGAGLLMALLLARRRRVRLIWVASGALVALLASTLPAVRALADDGTGSIRSRTLIWDAVLALAGPHPPLGIAGDEIAGEDRFHRLRPLLGHGPESVILAFPRVRPPQIRAWDTSIDRAHNETLERLATTGWAGVAAFWVLVWAFLELSLERLGLLPDLSSRRRLRALLAAGGTIGVLTPVLATGRLTFAALGLAAGVAAGLTVHLCRQPTAKDRGRAGLAAALTAALAGHLIEIQLSFPVAVTHAYSWVYLGLFLAATRRENEETGPESRPTAPGPVRAWRYAPLILAAAALIWLKNVDVVRADMALQAALTSGQRGQWADALTLHERAIALGAAEDRYHLALASTCQLAARDPEIRPEARRTIWRRGEQAALEARRLNPYNPDNSANLGRYYFTAGRRHFADAASYFEKAIALSPSDAALRKALADVYQAMDRPGDAARTLSSSTLP